MKRVQEHLKVEIQNEIKDKWHVHLSLHHGKATWTQSWGLRVCRAVNEKATEDVVQDALRAWVGRTA